MTNIVKFREWTFEVDRTLTEQTYKDYSGGTCGCNNCKNYVAYRNEIFSDEILKLFDDLGIDYRKEVEVVTYEKLPGGLHHISGWFHFKGQILTGKDYRVPLPSSGHTFKLSQISDNFSIGFTKASDLTFFKDETALVQLQFDSNIPWVIDKSLEGK